MSGLRGLCAKRQPDENGYVAVVVVICFAAFMFGCAALAVDTARWYVEGARLQRAADAATLGSVTYLPEDITKGQAAALALAKADGYDSASPNVTVTAQQGDKSSEMDVTICSTISNAFGGAIGFPRTTICRTSIADYTGPQPMGSPCNTLGNEPTGTSLAHHGPAASQLKVPTDATCSSTPNFWMHISGPNVPKENGDQYDTRNCSSSTSSGCSGTTNSDFQPTGYFLLVNVAQAAVGNSITLQLYDPEFAETDDRCTSTPSGTFPTTNLWNYWTQTDGLTRYHVTGSSESPNTFCTGDVMNNSSAGATITSFGLRAPTDTENPLKATPVQGCTKQWPGYTASQVTVANLYRSSNSSTYDNALNEVFHQWVDLCTFTPTAAGTYYLQARSNVALGGAVNNTTDGSYTPSVSSSSAMYTQTGDDTSVTGGGANRYAVRAFFTGGSTPQGALSVSADGQMPIYMNADASTGVFNLIRVLEGAQGKSMNFTFFDMGDAQSAATVTVLPPSDSNLSQSTMSCSATGFITNSALSGCALSGVNGAGNGKAETISVSIPNTYTCDYSSVGGCWFRVQVAFGSGTVSDTTTWSANITGEPVRLIQ